MLLMIRRLIPFLAAGLATIAPAAPARQDYAAMTTLDPAGGHISGNPRAPLKVATYVSYTCPHCAAFERESAAPLNGRYIPSGKVSVEVRHLLRDPIDATIAQLTNCGPKERFFGNHAAFMHDQARWIAPLASASEAQRQRWTSGDHASQRKAIAADFHFYDIMAKRGYSRPQLDACLADEGMARRIAAQTVEATRLGFDGTPSFTLNGTPLFGTNTWETLEAQLRARM